MQHRFPVSGEWVPVSGEWVPVSGEWVLVSGEWVPINKQHEDVGHKCDHVLYGWNDFCDEREFEECVDV